MKKKFLGLTLIAAVAKNGVIGKGGELPWNLPNDIKHFWNTVHGKTVLVGRKTFEKLPKKKLQKHEVDLIVLTSSPKGEEPGIRYARTMKEAMNLHWKSRNLYVAGGTRVYQEAMPYTTKMIITQVYAKPDGDTLFPEFDDHAWCLASAPTIRWCDGDQYQTDIAYWVKA